MSGGIAVFLGLSGQMLGPYPKTGHDGFLSHPLQFILQSPQPTYHTQRNGFQKLQSATKERVYAAFLTMRFYQTRHEKPAMISDQERPILISTLPQYSRISYNHFQNKHHL